MPACVLRLKRTDKSDQHLLVHVSQKSSSALDLKLIGTEHEHLYHAGIQESNVKALQADKFSGNLQEWKDVLRYVLLHEKPHGDLPDSLQGLETVAAISGKTLTITLRKNIGGITQRLGSIKLDQDDEREEVSAFDWVDTAVAGADDLRTRLDSLQASVSGQQDEVAKLTKQLDDLVKAKKEHEDELLKKFVALLNSKKLKIRDQQRLLATARVDPSAAEAVSEARGSGAGRRAEASRAGKRKARIEPEVEEDDDVANDDGEEEDEEMPDDEVQQETPPGTEDDATEDEDDLDRPAKASSSARLTADVEMDDDEHVSSSEPPITRKEAVASKQPEQVADDDDETDDEL